MPTDIDVLKVVTALLHSMHDDMLHSLMALEQLLKLFGEDMSWYEDWRKDHTNEKKRGAS